METLMEMKLDHISKHVHFRFIFNSINLHVDNDFAKGLCCEQKLRYWLTD